MNELKTLWGVDIRNIRKVLLSDNKWYDITKEHCDCSSFIVYGHLEKDPQYFELRTWKDDNVGWGICINGLVSQIKLLDTDWS
mgnify:FL=1